MSSATFYLTGDCNLRCKHCFVGHDQLAHRPAMPTEDVLTILGNLAAAGTRAVTFLGGEVTAFRHDLRAILAHCGELGLNASINTNLVDMRPLEAVLDIGALNNIVVSLDGLSPATHDRLRGKGSFLKTIGNLERLRRHPRVEAGEVTLDITFVLTAANRHEIFDLVELYKRLKLNKINFKTLQYNDRAERNRDTIGLRGRDLLDACTEFYVYCRLVGEVTIDLHVPPAFGAYLDGIFGLAREFWNFNSCGGTGVYTYVDLYGNNLPCPAMSFEENLPSTLTARSDRLNLVTNTVEEVRELSLFKGFDRTVAKRSRNDRMRPCSGCVFRDSCSPCTNEVIRGRDFGTVDVCMAVMEHGDDRVPGIRARLFAAQRRPEPVA